MRSNISTSFTALATLAFVGMSQAWLLEFFDVATCGAKGHSDTERGGVAGQSNKCMMVMEGETTMRLSDLDDNCTVALWPSSDPFCEQTPLWNKTKADLAKNLTGEVSKDGSFCVINLPGFGSASYVCPDNHDGDDI